MITIHGQLTEQDYGQAQQLHMQLTGWARLLPYATTAIWLVGFLFAGFKAIQGNLFFFVLLLPMTLFILVTPLTNRLLLPRQTKRLFRQNKEVSAPQEIEISENGVQLTNSFGHSTRAWSHYVKWKEDEHCFLLYHSDMLFNAIPQRFFKAPEEASFVRNQLQEHNVPVAGTPWPILSTRLMMLVLMLLLIGSMIINGLS